MLTRDSDPNLQNYFVGAGSMVDSAFHSSNFDQVSTWNSSLSPQKVICLLALAL